MQTIAVTHASIVIGKLCVYSFSDKTTGLSQERSKDLKKVETEFTNAYALKNTS